ncbi:MAG: efflux RND transporter periplasmic adaptor subunit [Alphaproteobacteria bacterium]
MKKTFRRIVGGVLTVGLLVFLIWAFRPAPVPVDLGTAERGPLVVTVDELGRTRVREIYVISAPVAGRLLRIDSEPGDPVLAQQTIVATILPNDPAFLDARSLGEAEAAVRSAEAALALAEAERERAEAELDFARSELVRARQLRERGTISQSALDRAELDIRSAEAALRTAEATVRVRRAELESARARLVNPEQGPEGDMAERAGVVTVRSPVSGRILRVRQESEGTVLAGTPLVDVGDPRNDLEIVVELLSTDAVQVTGGARVVIDDWGGPKPLKGEVSRIEPFGFTKISALGVEEQRVNVIIQLLDPPEDRLSLAHGFRVETRIVVWEEGDVLHVPASALFRQGTGWAVYRMADGRARLTSVTPGRTNGERTQILDGLALSDRVVLFPGERLSDGVSITDRRS